VARDEAEADDNDVLDELDIDPEEETAIVSRPVKQ
jgi:hypothetical protein